MIYFNSNEASFLSLVATFTDNGSPIKQYTNDRPYYEKLVAKWGHLSDLHIEPLIPTQEQQERLDIVNGLDDSNKDLWQGSYAVFVEHGIVIAEEAPEALAALAEDYQDTTLNYFREIKRQEFKQQRDEGTAAPINNIQVGRIEDRENIQGAVRNFESLGLVDGKKKWVMADNSIALLSKDELAYIEPAYAIRKDACFAAYEQAIQALQAAHTIEEVLDVQMPSLDA